VCECVCARMSVCVCKEKVPDDIAHTAPEKGAEELADHEGL